MTALRDAPVRLEELVDAEAPAALELLQEQARGYARASKAPNTLRSYRADLADFQGWCQAHDVAWLPAAPASIALYVTALAQSGRKAATIAHRMAAIGQAHLLAGQLPSPTAHPEVRATLSGIRRTIGTAKQGKAPLVTDELRRLVRSDGPTPLAEVRDRLILLLGFAAALRRSDLVALDVEDVEETADGVVVHLRRSKTDQEAAGEDRAVPFGQHPETCPVRALRAWLAASDISEGALLRPINRHGQLRPGRLTDRSIARIVQRDCDRAGLEPAKYAGHSLRAGLATSAADSQTWSSSTCARAPWSTWKGTYSRALVGPGPSNRQRSWSWTCSCWRTLRCASRGANDGGLVAGGARAGEKTAGRIVEILELDHPRAAAGRRRRVARRIRRARPTAPGRGRGGGRRLR